MVASTASLAESLQAGVSGEFMNWMQNYQLWPAEQNAVFSLRSKNTFDTIDDEVGVLWWPRVKGMLPVVGLSRTPNGFCIRVAFIRPAKNEPEAFAMRFETPHGTGGNHSFHHAQLVQELTKGEPATRLRKPQSWVPTTQPSFPLRACTPLELLWATAVAVYGRQEATKPFVGAAGGARRSLGEYVKGLL